MKKTATEHSIPEELFENILLEYKHQELIDKIILALYRYDENGIEGLADGAAAFHVLYEEATDTSTARKYFREYYENWICLVIETEQGDIYQYTKKELVLAFRALRAHGKKTNIPKERLYLLDFVKGNNSPSVLFIDGGRNIGCLPEYKRKQYMEKDYPFILTKKYNLNMKEITILNIFGELFTYVATGDLYRDRPGLMMDTDYLKHKKPNIANKVIEQINIIRQKNPRRHTYEAKKHH